MNTCRQLEREHAPSALLAGALSSELAVAVGRYGAGIQHAIFILRNQGPAPLEAFGKEVIPEVAGF